MDKSIWGVKIGDKNPTSHPFFLNNKVIRNMLYEMPLEKGILAYD